MGFSPETVFAFTRGLWCRADWGWALDNSPVCSVIRHCLLRV